MADRYYKIVCEEISRNGFKFWKTAKGSHEKWRSEETGVIVLVPRNLKSRHTANGILKDAGCAKKL